MKSIAPNLSIAKATSASTSASFRRSVRLNAQPAPISPASAAPCSSSTSAETTLAPAEVKARASPAPMPLAPPVTMATRPLMPFMDASFRCLDDDRQPALRTQRLHVEDGAFFLDAKLAFLLDQ